MKISRRAIRRIIREALTPQGAQQKYGSVLFGDARGLGEPDTPPEDELEAALDRWGGSGPGSPELQAALQARHIEELRDLYDSGLYSDVLKPRSKKALRFIKLDSAKASELARGRGKRVEFNGHVIGALYIIRGKRFPILPGMPAASWTESFANDRLDYLFDLDPDKPCGLFAVARTDGPNEGALLFNPWEMGEIGSFEAETELLQIEDLNEVDMHILIPVPGAEEEMSDYIAIYGADEL